MDVKIPIYGNWCGPGHPRNGNDPYPIDEIDHACQVHDSNYESGSSGIWGDSEADRELANKALDILRRGTLWVNKDTGDGNVQQVDSVEISTEQYIAAAKIAAWMNSQQFITVIPDVLDGKLSAVAKLVVAGVPQTFTVPGTVTIGLLSKFNDQIGDPQITREALQLLVKANAMAVDIVLDVSELAEKSIDEIGDGIEATVKEIGDVTKLRKPVREVREEVILLVTNPKKAAKRLVRKLRKIF